MHGMIHISNFGKLGGFPRHHAYAFLTLELFFSLIAVSRAYRSHSITHEWLARQHTSSTYGFETYHLIDGYMRA